MRNACGNGGVVDHLCVLTNHRDAAKARTDGQESFLSLLVGHAGRAGSCPGKVERPAWTLDRLARRSLSVGAAQVQTRRRGAGGVHQYRTDSLGRQPAAAPHVSGRVADGLVVEVQPRADMHAALRLPVTGSSLTGTRA